MPGPVLLGFLLVQAASAQGPEQFFVGRTESTGTVSIVLSGRHTVRDRSTGRIAPGKVLSDLPGSFEERHGLARPVEAGNNVIPWLNRLYPE